YPRTLTHGLRIPSCQPPGAVQSLSGKAGCALVRSRTVIFFSKELDQFGAPSLPASSFVASNEEAPETIRFRVAVNEIGEIRYCFPINSSGDPALDEQARLHVVRSRFAPSTAAGISA